MTKRSHPGVYHLVLSLGREVTLRVGKLGRFTFPAGCYVYTGSARAGLEARIARHRRREKRMRWHIDYLLREARIVEVAAIPTARRIECARNRALLRRPEARLIVPRFGSSDCRCPAHLVYFAGARPRVSDRPRPPQERGSEERI